MKIDFAFFSFFSSSFLSIFCCWYWLRQKEKDFCRVFTSFCIEFMLILPNIYWDKT